jgi:hypothetical protein
LIDEQTLYAVSDQGSVRAWNLSEIDTVWWNTLFGTETNRSYIELDSRSGPGVGQVNSLLVVHETYNWPNPIRDGTTNLRFMTRADSRVTVMILDLAGHLVATETVENVRAFIPTEIVWQTDAASGLYVARVKAETPEGVSDSKLIKMAIIR